MSRNESVVEKIVVLLLGAIIVMAIVSVILALPTMFLWNWLMPDIFGLPKIGFFQALGLNILSAILFKNGSSSYKKKD